MNIPSSCVSTSLSWHFPNVCKRTTSIKREQNQIERNDEEKENDGKAFTGELH